MILAIYIVKSAASAIALLSQSWDLLDSEKTRHQKLCRQGQVWEASLERGIQRLKYQSINYQTGVEN